MTRLGVLVLACLLLGLPALAQNPLEGVLAQLLTSPKANWDTILERNQGSLSPEQIPPVIKRATSLAARGRDREAADLVRAVDYVEYFLTGKQEYRGSGQIALALFMLESGQQVRAGSLAEELVKEHPQMEAAQLLMGRVLASTAPAEAIQWFQKVAEANPSSEPAWEGIGQIYLMAGQLNDALKAFQKVLEINPRNGLAQEVVQKLSRPSTGQPPSKNPTAMKHFNQAEQLFQKRMFEAAIQQYDLALKADPKFARAWLYKGDCYYRMGAIDRAIACFRKAIQLDPKNPEAYRFLADVLAHQYDATRNVAFIDEAIGALEQALKLNPNYAAARSDLENARKIREAHGK